MRATGRDSKSNGSGGGGGGGQIPPSVKKVVQNLKEIVDNNCTDSEIYAVLRDCNMDPNDAVERLLSQDTFHEVKSRRERRKEMKETSELKARANNGTTNHGVRGGSEHCFGWSGSIQISSNELGKAAYRKENGSVASIPHPAPSILCPIGQTWNEQPSLQSNSFNADNRRQPIGTGDMIYSSSQPSAGSSTLMGATLGHVTMADIVRMSRPQRKGSEMLCETAYTPQDAVSPNSSFNQMKPPLATSPSQLETHQDLHSSDLNVTGESGKKSNRHDIDNEWPVNETITASSDIGGTMHSNQSYLHSNRANLSSNSCSDNILFLESNAAVENLSSDYLNSAKVSSKLIFMNDSGGTSEHDDDLCKDRSSPDSYRLLYEHQEGIGRGSNISVPNPSTSLSDDDIKVVSSAMVNIQQLSLGKEERAVTPTEDNQGVVLPNYLQAFSADCSHLSFGTYKSDKSTALSIPQTSSSMVNGLEEILTASNGPSSMHLNSRNLVYGDEEQLEFDFDTNRATADARNNNSPNFSQAELKKLDIPDAAAHGNDYVSHSSIPGSSFKNIQQLSSASPFVIDPITRNLPPFPSEVVLNSGALSASQLSSQALHGANLASGSVLKEHLSAHSYSQTGYPAIPQGHAYTPSALQQAYLDGNMFRDSHAGMKYNHPHYRNASMNSFSLSGYRSLGNSADIPGSLSYNLSVGPAGRKVGYDGFLRSQYRDGGANFNQLQQNDGPADYGHGARTISTIPTIPDSAYYSLQGQNHKLSGYHQGLRHLHLNGALGYPGVYNSQTGITIEQQQQQDLGNMIINGSRSPSSKQLPQIWQHNY